MKAQVNTVEREVVTKVKDEVVVLTVSKLEFGIIQDALMSYSHVKAKDAALRGGELFSKVQKQNGSINDWWYDGGPNRFDTAFTEVK